MSLLHFNNICLDCSCSTEWGLSVIRLALRLSRVSLVPGDSVQKSNNSPRQQDATRREREPQNRDSVAILMLEPPPKIGTNFYWSRICMSLIGRQSLAAGPKMWCSCYWETQQAICTMCLHAIRQNDRMDLVTCIDGNVSNTVNVLQDFPLFGWVLFVFLLYHFVIIVSFVSAAQKLQGHGGDSSLW